MTKEKTMLEMMKKFVRDEEGVTAIEYGLIAALIAVVIVVAVGEVGENLNSVFEKVRDELVITP